MMIENNSQIKKLIIALALFAVLIIAGCTTTQPSPANAPAINTAGVNGAASDATNSIDPLYSDFSFDPSQIVPDLG